MKVKLAIVLILILAMICVGLGYLNTKKVETIPNSEEIVKEFNGKLRIEIIPESPIVGESVSIVVRDSEGNPVKGVKVYIANETGRRFIGTTDSNGELTYVFKWYGWYKIELEKEGYLPSERPIHVKPKGYLTLSISGSPKDGKWLTTITVYSAGKPVENVKIYVNGSFVGYTDNNGQLTCVFEPNKSYIILAKKEGFAPSKTETKCPPLISK